MYCINGLYKFYNLLQLLKHVTIASGGVLPWIHHELLHRKRGGIQMKPTTATTDGPSASKKPKVIPAASLPAVPATPIKGGKAAKLKAVKPPKVLWACLLAKLWIEYLSYRKHSGVVILFILQKTFRRCYSIANLNICVIF